jgi:hypothetical protein
MKYIPGYLDSFISPITGQFVIPGLQSLTNNYAWVGNRNNIAQESPILIDIRLDIITLRKLLATTSFILQTAIGGLDNSQALDVLGNGFVYTTDGILSIGKPGPGTLILPHGMVYVGNAEDFAEAFQTINQDNLPSLTENYFWLGDSSNRPIETNFLPIGGLPDLPQNNLWIGDSSNRPTPISTFNGNFGLTSQYIWRGNTFGLAVPVNDLTTLEGTVASQGTSILDLIQGISNLVNIVNGLTATVNAIEAGLALIGGFPVLVSLIATVAGLSAASIATNIRIDNLTLNGIANSTATSGDVNINNHKLTNVSDPSSLKDAVNLETLQSYVGGFPNTLVGFVVGGPAVGGVMTTFRGPTCTLDVIPAAADVSVDGFAITNLETLSFSRWTDMEDKAQNALNFLFLWEFFGGGVA